jgi:hypothetical protein
MRSLLAVVAVFLAASTCIAASAAQPQSRWTATDRAAARQAAHHEARKLGRPADRTGWPTNVHRVTAIIDSGSVSGGSNTGHPCGSGQHAVVTLIGNFPTIVVSGTPGSGSTAVHGVILTTKLGRNRICKISVQTGKVRPAPHSHLLFKR